MVSPTYISALVIILAQVLPKLGLTIGTEEVTTLVTAGITLISSIVILVRRYQKGGVNIAGFHKLG